VAATLLEASRFSAASRRLTVAPTVACAWLKPVRLASSARRSVVRSALVSASVEPFRWAEMLRSVSMKPPSPPPWPSSGGVPALTRVLIWTDTPGPISRAITPSSPA
jgi:hypothetical protein